MSLVTFYYNGVDGATITQSGVGEDTSHGLVNLYDRNKNLYWKAANANTSGYLDIDFGTARYCDSLVLVSHNYDSYVNPGPSGIKLAYDTNDNGSYSALTYVVGSSGAYHAYAAANLYNWVETFDSVSKRYWRLYLESLGAATYQQIGFIMLGLKFQHSVNWNFGDGQIGYDWGVETGETTGGHRRRQLNHYMRRSWEYTFEYIDETHRTNLQTFLAAVYGSFYPFIFTNEESSIYYAALNHRRTDVTHLNYQEYNVRLSLEEEL